MGRLVVVGGVADSKRGVIAVVSAFATASNDTAIGRSGQSRAIDARIDGRAILIPIEDPLLGIAGQIGVPPTTVALRPRAHALRARAAINHQIGVVERQWIGRHRPRVNALLVSAGRGVVPLGFGGQATAIPSAERERLVPGGAREWLVLVGARRVGPRRFARPELTGPRGDEVRLRRR